MARSCSVVSAGKFATMLFDLGRAEDGIFGIWKV